MKPKHLFLTRILNRHQNFKPFQFFLLLFLILLLPQPASAQVVIKEKVEINFSNTAPMQLTKPASIVTPYYGDVTIGFNSTVGGANTKVILRVGDASKRIYPPWEPECRPGYPWFSNGWMYDAIENQPAFSPVSIEMEACKTITGNPYDTQWHKIPVLIGEIVNNSAPVYAYMNFPEEPAVWPNVANLGFVEKIPPDCNSVFDCTEENFLPEIKLVQKPIGYQGIQCRLCEEKAFFLPAFTLSDGYSIASICFNKQLQRWWFNLNDNHSFVYNYVLEICEANIACGGQILIDDWTDFPPNYDCDSLLSDVRDHFIYPIDNAKYIMRDIVLAHEEQHKKYFESLTIPLSKHWLDWRLEQEDIKDCDDFSTLAEAENYWNVRLKKIYEDWELELYSIFISNTGKYKKNKEYEHEIWTHEQTMKNYKWLEERVRFRYLCLFNL